MGLIDFYTDPMGKRYKKKSWGQRLGTTALKKRVKKAVFGPFRALSPSRQWKNFKYRTGRKIGLRSEFAKAWRSGKWGKYAKRKVFGESEAVTSMIKPFYLKENYGPTHNDLIMHFNRQQHDGHQSGIQHKGMFHKLGKAVAFGAAVGVGMHGARRMAQVVKAMNGGGSFVSRFGANISDSVNRIGRRVANTAEDQIPKMAAKGMKHKVMKWMGLPRKPNLKHSAVEIAMNMLLEANKLTKLAMGGKLSDRAIAAAREAKMLRSPRRMVSGLNRGTQKLHKAQGSTEHFGNVTATGGGGGLTVGKDVFITKRGWGDKMTYPNRRTRGAEKAVVRRHEANEVSALSKAVKDDGTADKLANIYNKGNKVGMHGSLGVLGHEANNVRRLNIHGVDTSGFEKLRRKTGESRLIKKETGKQYGKEGLSKKDIKLLRNKKKSEVPGVKPGVQDMMTSSAHRKDLSGVMGAAGEAYEGKSSKMDAARKMAHHVRSARKIPLRAHVVPPASDELMASRKKRLTNKIKGVFGMRQESAANGGMVMNLRENFQPQVYQHNRPERQSSFAAKVITAGVGVTALAAGAKMGHLVLNPRLLARKLAKHTIRAGEFSHLANNSAGFGKTHYGARAAVAKVKKGVLNALSSVAGVVHGEKEVKSMQRILNNSTVEHIMHGRKGQRVKPYATIKAGGYSRKDVASAVRRGVGYKHSYSGNYKQHEQALVNDLSKVRGAAEQNSFTGANPTPPQPAPAPQATAKPKFNVNTATFFHRTRKTERANRKYTRSKPSVIHVDPKGNARVGGKKKAKK